MTAKGNLSAAAGSVVVPYGHVVGNEKWRGSEMARRLQGEREQRPSVPRWCRTSWNALHSVVATSEFVAVMNSAVFALLPLSIWLQLHRGTAGCRVLQGRSVSRGRLESVVSKSC